MTIATTTEGESKTSGIAALGAGLALVLYQLAPPLPALAGVAALFGLAWVFPSTALVAVPLSLPFYLVARPIFGEWSFSGTEVAILVCALAAGIRFVLRPRRPRLTTEDLLIAAVLVLAVLSLSVSVRPRESLRELRTIIAEPLVFYYLVVTLVKDRRGITRMVNALVVAGLAISLVALYQYCANENIITAEEGLRRVRGLYGSPNHLGLFLGRVIPLTLCMLIAAGKKRALYCAALVPMLLTLVLTFSAGAWIGLAAALVLLAGLQGRRALVLAAGSVVAIVVVSVPLLAGLARFRAHLSLAEGTSLARMQLWQAAAAMIRDHPILGVGLDTFLYHYSSEYMLPAAWREPYISHPHNLLLDFWLRLGLGGLVVFALLIVSFFVRGIGLVRQTAGPLSNRSESRQLRWIVTGLLAGMTSFAIHGLIDNSYFLVDLAVIFWLSFAILRVSANLIAWQAPSRLPSGCSYCDGPAGDAEKLDGKEEST